ncbi:MAG: alpha/beta fold hydrolase [Pirellulales bacterium]
MADDWRSLYPFASHFLPLAGGRLHYVDEGSGSPVLMVHGNPTWSFYYRELIQAARRDHRAIAVDHLGCGLSDKPQQYAYTLANHTANLVRLIEQLDLSDITLVVHDWGGAIGLGAAAARPERFGRLLILNTGAFPPPYVPHRIRACRLPVAGRIALRGLNLFARAAVTMATEQRGGLAPAVRAGLLAPYDSWANRVAVWGFVRDIPLTRRHPTWQTLADLEASLPRLAHLPVHMVWGMKDWCFTEVCLNRLLTAFPNAQVDRIKDAGHYVMEDARDAVVASFQRFRVGE